MRTLPSAPWFRHSELDLAMARRLMAAGLYEGVAFHSQQAAEKALKGLLIGRHGVWMRTHSTKKLLGAVTARGLALPKELWGRAEELDRHYMLSRYPEKLIAEAKPYTPVIARTALATAEEIVALVRAAGASGPAPGEVRETRAAPAWGLEGASATAPPACLEMLKGFVSALSESMPVKALVLFGSRARGDNSPDSDYDFILVSDHFVGRDYGERRDLPDDVWWESGPPESGPGESGPPDGGPQASGPKQFVGPVSADIFCLSAAELADLSSPLVWEALAEGYSLLDDGTWARAAAEFQRMREAGLVTRIEGGWAFRPEL